MCGHAAIEGHAVGIIGNNGPIDADGATKADALHPALLPGRGMPIVYLQNTTGYMVGREAERAGIIKHGSKMIQAVANATVPQLTIHVGARFGAGNYGMCGRAYDPRFIFAWPSNRIAVMGGEQAAKVMAIVTEDEAAARRQAGRQGQDRACMEKAIVTRMERRIHCALHHGPAVGRRRDRSARHARVLGFCLVASAARPKFARSSPTHFGVARM